MYPKIVREHFTHPKNVGKIKNPTVIGSYSLPNLAKAIFYFLIEDGIIKDIKYQITGCPFAIAVCSILSEYAKEKNVEELKNIKLETLEQFFEIPEEKEECINLSLKAFLDGVKAA